MTTPNKKAIAKARAKTAASQARAADAAVTAVNLPAAAAEAAAGHAARTFGLPEWVIPAAGVIAAAWWFFHQGEGGAR